MVDYIITSVPSACNIIMGIPLLKSMRVTLSIYNLDVQYFEDNDSVERIMGDQKSENECYIATLKATILSPQYKVGEASNDNKRQD